jgi:uncharacterized protein
MKKPIIICTVIFCLFFYVSAPATNDSISSVWKISKDGKSLFLGGSVHILRNEDFPLPKAFDIAFEQSSMLILEANVDEMEEEWIMQYLMTQLFLPDNQTLNSVLNPETYVILQAKCKQYGIPMDSISKLKPSIIVNMLSALEMQKLGFAQEGVDLHYLKKAKKINRPLGFLESVEVQIDMLVNMGDGYEDDFVRYSLHDMNSTEIGLEDIVAEWRKGKASSTEISVLEMRKQWPILYKTLLSDRNSAWMPKIINYLATETPEFIIVGLAHLHGPDGLLKQLADSGCTVEQLK